MKVKAEMKEKQAPTRKVIELKTAWKKERASSSNIEIMLLRSNKERDSKNTKSLWEMLKTWRVDSLIFMKESQGKPTFTRASQDSVCAFP